MFIALIECMCSVLGVYVNQTGGWVFMFSTERRGVLQAYSATLTLSLPVTTLCLYHDWEFSFLRLKPNPKKKESSSRLALFQCPACAD